MNQEPQKTIKPPKFIFPKKLAERMKKVPTHIQMESAMLATTFLLLGLIFIAVYQIFFTEIPTTLKVAITFNIVCGLVIMGGYIITSYQQYVNYILTCGIDLKEEKQRLKRERKQKALAKKAMKMASALKAAGYSITPNTQQEQKEEIGNSSQNLSVQAGCKDPQMSSGGVSDLITSPVETKPKPKLKNIYKKHLNKKSLPFVSKFKKNKEQRMMGKKLKKVQALKLKDIKEVERRFIENI